MPKLWKDFVTKVSDNKEIIIKVGSAVLFAVFTTLIVKEAVNGLDVTEPMLIDEIIDLEPQDVSDVT